MLRNPSIGSNLGFKCHDAWHKICRWVDAIILCPAGDPHYRNPFSNLKVAPSKIRLGGPLPRRDFVQPRQRIRIPAHQQHQGRCLKIRLRSWNPDLRFAIGRATRLIARALGGLEINE
jgi:hypothetical protein